MIPISRSQFVAEAREWIGTPFIHGQSLKGVGCDCIGLIVGVAKQFRLPAADRWLLDPRFHGYGRMPQPDKLLAACREYLIEIPVSQAGFGQIMQYTFSKEPMHFAIISSDDPKRVIHGYERAHGVVENGANTTFWKALRAYHLPGVA